MAPWRGGRVVDRTALEMRHRCKPIGGSNPSLSANKLDKPLVRIIFFDRSRVSHTFRTTLFSGFSDLGWNILVFADGTGNESGLLPGESRIISPLQALPSDKGRPGLGDRSVGTGRFLWARCGNARDPSAEFGATSGRRDQSGCRRWTYQPDHRSLLRDVSVWQPADRVYLFGFSRGAYCARYSVFR
jgi:type VI secretion system (T6SS) phospholipase Tle1-like effector